MHYLYRNHITRDYLVQSMLELPASDSWFDIFKEPAISDFQMILDSIIISVVKDAETVDFLTFYNTAELYQL